MTILVTGAAGFIGFHLCNRLLDRGLHVVGIDNLNHYYDVTLKQARLDQLVGRRDFRFVKLDISDRNDVDALFAGETFSAVVNLAAQAGVRYSLINPNAYITSNVVGFANILEACRQHSVGHLVYASSSSVYGASTKMPFSVHQNVDHPLSVYGATKKANELLAHSYSHLFSLPTTGLRFFTVYGPWGRPDMALFMFTRAILAGEPIRIFNNGQMERDFTYIDDIIEAVARLIDHVPTGNQSWDSNAPDPGSSSAPYRVYNIGNSRPEQLSHLIETLERCLGKSAVKQFLPMQPGDLRSTYADTDDLEREINFLPSTSIDVGIDRFVRWYRDFYDVSSPR
jgi:UDP-glucuronate 4-epimerase